MPLEIIIYIPAQIELSPAALGPFFQSSSIFLEFQSAKEPILKKEQLQFEGQFPGRNADKALSFYGALKYQTEALSPQELADLAQAGLDENTRKLKLFCTDEKELYAAAALASYAVFKQGAFCYQDALQTSAQSLLQYSEEKLHNSLLAAALQPALIDYYTQEEDENQALLRRCRKLIEQMKAAHFSAAPLQQLKLVLAQEEFLQLRGRIEFQKMLIDFLEECTLSNQELSLLRDKMEIRKKRGFNPLFPVLILSVLFSMINLIEPSYVDFFGSLSSAAALGFLWLLLHKKWSDKNESLLLFLSEVLSFFIFFLLYLPASSFADDSALATFCTAAAATALFQFLITLIICPLAILTGLLKKWLFNR